MKSEPNEVHININSFKVNNVAKIKCNGEKATRYQIYLPGIDKWHHLFPEYLQF